MNENMTDSEQIILSDGGNTENTQHDSMLPNEVPKKGKLKKKTIAIISVAAVVIAIVAIFFTIVGISASAVNGIFDSIEHGELTPEQTAYKYESMSSVVKPFARADIKKKLIKAVKDNPYVMTDDELVDVELVEKYKKYNALSTVINLSDDTNTNVTEYIDCVMKIAEYEADSNCMKIISAVADDFSETVTNWNSLLNIKNGLSGTSAVLGNSYWASALTYLKQIKEHSENAVAIAEQYNYTDEKSQQIISALEYIRDNIMSALSDSTVQWTIKAYVENIKTISNNMLVVRNDIERIVEELPEVY